MNEAAPTKIDSHQAASDAALEAERVMAFDFGMRRIGIAIGVRLTGTASPLLVLENTQNGPNLQRLDALIREWRPQALVVGYPITLDGSEQTITIKAKQFAAQLQTRYQLPVASHDERFTSREAERRFAAGRQAGNKRRKDAALLDAVAAQVILESWFSHHAH